MNIYVGNISRELNEKEIRKAFEEYGEVTTVNLIKDKLTGQLKGFGFVEMPNKEEGQKAIEGLDGQRLSGRALNVAEAKPRSDNSMKTNINSKGQNRPRY